MLLTSWTYFVFLVAMFFLYWPLAQRRAAALAVILFANYFFYARWNFYYLLLIPALSTCDFLLGQALEKSTNQTKRRILVTTSILMNLSVLAIFKYMPFFLDNWARWTGRPVIAWHLTLPVTLSFYVFQALTYTIDIYRRDATATPSYLAHLSAVSFFPTTLAGPITRVSSLIAQMEKRKPLDPTDGSRALFLIGMGLTKKLMIADYLGANLVDRVFDFPNLYSGTEAIVTAYAYALQLYYDFSGYTDIAIGSALLFGIKLPQNFNMPYAALNIADFWRRWHISLSNWLRDYLYFSLPGIRSKWKFVPYLNLAITMVIGGLWHGPNWTFVIWGAMHGAGLVMVRLWQEHRPKQMALLPAGFRKYASIILTAHFVTVAWVFFRAPSVEVASAVLGRTTSGTVSFSNISRPLWMVLGIGLLAHYVPKRWYDGSLNLYMRAPFYAQAAALAALVVGLQYVVSTGAAPFIYNQF